MRGRSSVQVLAGKFLVGALAAALTVMPVMANAYYVQTDLVSSVPGLAVSTDPSLINPWGLASLPGSPFWASDQGTNASSLITGAGSVVPLTVNVPTNNSAPPTGPTGIVANSTSAFDIPTTNGSAPARFLFATLQGTIAGWNQSTPGGLTQAETVLHQAGAVFTGLTQASVNGTPYLYAANFASGKINVYNSSFQSATLPGTFTDPNLPAGYSPYNVQAVGNTIYVLYSKVGSNGLPVIAAGDGIIDAFSPSGEFISRFATQNSALNVPWGITMAPGNFGQFSNDLLVGQFGSGVIDAFDPRTGTFLGMLAGANGAPLVNDFTWGLEFDPAGPSGVNPDALYFNAGIDNQQQGLFGDIVVPEPASASLLGTALFGLWALRGGRRGWLRRS